MTEEVARWAFEVHLDRQTDWVIAFVNPTAGPWKRILGRDTSQQPGEVHRFDREELRPDLVLFNDALEVVLIVEAKDQLQQLTRGPQVKKSVRTLTTLAATLRNKATNLYWGDRARYSVITGLLWGAEAPTSVAQRTAALELYSSELQSSAGASSLIVGIECRRSDDAQSVTCRGTLSSNSEVRPGVTAADLLLSLELVPLD